MCVSYYHNSLTTISPPNRILAPNVLVLPLIDAIPNGTVAILNAERYIARVQSVSSHFWWVVDYDRLVNEFCDLGIQFSSNRYLLLRRSCQFSRSVQSSL